ncbi:MAG: DUF72 domain-containing protein [Sphingomonas sp.]|uniref:DUF72 domain-containing protein n=1 Tax=Sphingomonas sp. TaxID=28214 RepID=UPI001ACA4000|nr:DUF72 domain-containing protein [Sphingomonas sp.]MBN8809423.1 DUF72 domain-containing protein [Sphingomonas sp.]
MLARYATRFDAVEVNSSFYRPHLSKTYARWAASVPDDFRFAVKLPKAITHEARLVGGDALLAAFAAQTGWLGEKRGPILVQLPPSLAFDASVAATFFDTCRRHLGEAPIACEPRHAGWFADAADALLVAHRVARVAADPAPVPAAATAGGWRGLRYVRLHGSPHIYRSSYDDAAIDREVMAARAASDSWTIFDNTASGAATANALTMLARVTAS